MARSYDHLKAKWSFQVLFFNTPWKFPDYNIGTNGAEIPFPENIVTMLHNMTYTWNHGNSKCKIVFIYTLVYLTILRWHRHHLKKTQTPNHPAPQLQKERSLSTGSFPYSYQWNSIMLYCLSLNLSSCQENIVSKK